MPVTTNTRKLAALLGASGAGIGTDGLMQAAGIDTDMATQTELDAIPVFDATEIRHDILGLALRQAVNENSGDFNLPNSFVDDFHDSTGSGTFTTTVRNSGEYIVPNTSVDTYGTLANIPANFWDDGALATWSYGSGTVSHGSSPDEDAGPISTVANNLPADTPWQFSYDSAAGSGYGPHILFAPTANRPSGSPTNSGTTWKPGGAGGSEYTAGVGQSFRVTRGSSSGGAWAWSNSSSGTASVSYSGFGGNSGTILIQRSSLGAAKIYKAASLELTIPTTGSPRFLYAGAMTVQVMGWGSHASSFSNFQYSTGTAGSGVVAAGTLVGNANVPSSAQTKVSGVMLHQQGGSGTSVIGTDIKIYFTCDNSAWTEAASYTTVTPVFSGTTQMVKLGETTCTSGSDVRYKAVWANQGVVKESRLHGIGINY